MAYLAAAPSGMASAREIATRFNIPLEVLAKVLQRLAQCDLVVSQMGVHGGYRLARPSDGISVAEVVQAIDGPLAITACSSGDERCEQFSKCSVRDPLWRLKARIHSALTTLSVAEMVPTEAR
jgi:Rrf2 family protein